eukprot:1982881-Amphidinium_carterae.2
MPTAVSPRTAFGSPATDSPMACIAASSGCTPQAEIHAPSMARQGLDVRCASVLFPIHTLHLLDRLGEQKVEDAR